MEKKRCPQCGMLMAKSGSYVEQGTGLYVEVFECSDAECGNIWYHKLNM